MKRVEKKESKAGPYTAALKQLKRDWAIPYTKQFESKWRIPGEFRSGLRSVENLTDIIQRLNKNSLTGALENNSIIRNDIKDKLPTLMKDEESDWYPILTLGRLQLQEFMAGYRKPSISKYPKFSNEATKNMTLAAYVKAFEAELPEELKIMPIRRSPSESKKHYGERTARSNRRVRALKRVSGLTLQEGRPDNAIAATFKMLATLIIFLVAPRKISAKKWVNRVDEIIYSIEELEAIAEEQDRKLDWKLVVEEFIDGPEIEQNEDEYSDDEDD